MTPSFLITIWLSGFLSLSGVGGALFALHRWYHDSWGWDTSLERSHFEPGISIPALALLVAAAGLALLALCGRPLVCIALVALRPSEADPEPDPRESIDPADSVTIARPDGSTLYVEFYGPVDGAPLLCTHGWGLNSGEWNYLKRHVPSGYRLIVWDLPGSGKSLPPANRDFSVEKFATDLHEVLLFLGPARKPAVLMGHSIGGMIVLTFCRLFPAALESSVAGIVLIHTTPTNPVRTTSGAALLSLIEKPVLVPLAYVTIALSPLVWLMNWLAYLNGIVHLINLRSSFAGTETWQQIDFSARFQPRVSPAILARGMLGMMRYDAIAVLKTISVPALVVTGDQDTTTKPSAGRAIQKALPKASLLELAPAKHLGFIEHNHRFQGAVFAFCEKLRPVAHPLSA
jgi:pimeloyl-ACP methyl ester carboxylesterase